jgi:Domain of unknown function (DUF4845)
MRGRSKQSGMSAWGILLTLALVGFFAMCTIRMAPPYFEYLSVKDIVERIVTDPETDGLSISAIRRKLDSIFNTNQIYGLESKEVAIYRKEGKMYVDASYEVRVPLIWRIDGVIKFDDLKYRVGSSEAVQTDKKK